MERGIEQYLTVLVIAFVVLADFVLGLIKRRFGKSGHAEVEAPREFEFELEPEMEPEVLRLPEPEVSRLPEPEVLLPPEPVVRVPRVVAVAPRERRPVRGAQHGLRQPTARAAKSAVAPLFGSRADLRRAIVLREVLGPPKALE